MSRGIFSIRKLRGQKNRQNVLPGKHQGYCLQHCDLNIDLAPAFTVILKWNVFCKLALKTKIQVNGLDRGENMKSLFSEHINVAARVMDLRLDRQNVVAGNLANLSNPEYQPRRLDFEDELQSALNMDDRGRMSRTSPGHQPSRFEASTFDGSLSKEFRIRVVQGQDGVDLDQEMAIQNKNTLNYNTLSQVLRQSFAGLQDVINKGGQ